MDGDISGKAIQALHQAGRRVARGLTMSAAEVRWREHAARD